MTFETEKNKLRKLWNEVDNNRQIIITQKDDNAFIIDNINELNRLDTSISILKNFGTDWITPITFTEIHANPSIGEFVTGNVQEFRLTFNNVNENFIPFIHSEVLYRVGESGVIPLDEVSAIPFDEDLGTTNMIQKSEIYQITDNSDNTKNVEYITYMRMDLTASSHPEVQYKFICYLLNPNYYQST